MYIHRLCGISEQNNFISFGSVPEFEASQYPVTNGEFLEFVESGGYQNRQLWTDEGQALDTEMTNVCPITTMYYCQPRMKMI